MIGARLLPRWRRRRAERTRFASSKFPEMIVSDASEVPFRDHLLITDKRCLFDHLVGALLQTGTSMPALGPCR